MVYQISEWAKDPTVCDEGREYSRINNTPKEHYCNSVLPEWFLFRVYYRWPEEALKIAIELASAHIEKNTLDDLCREALEAAIDVSRPNEEIRKFIEPIKDAANVNKNGEKLISILLRWRLGEKWRPAGPFMVVLKNYLTERGNENVDAELIAYLKSKISIEKWCEDLVP